MHSWTAPLGLLLTLLFPLLGKADITQPKIEDKMYRAAIIFIVSVIGQVVSVFRDRSLTAFHPGLTDCLLLASSARLGPGRAGKILPDTPLYEISM